MGAWQFCIFLGEVVRKKESFYLRVKLWKNPRDIILHECIKNHDHILYCSWYMARDRCNCYFSSWAIFCPFTPLTAQKIKFFKKNSWRYHHFTYVYQKLWSADIRFLRYSARRTDGRTNRQADGRTDEWMDRQTGRRKKWHIDVGAPPNNEKTIYIENIFPETNVSLTYFQLRIHYGTQ